MIISILLLLKGIKLLFKILVFSETNGFSWLRCICISIFDEGILYGGKILIVFCCCAVVAVDAVAISVAFSKIKLKFFYFNCNICSAFLNCLFNCLCYVRGLPKYNPALLFLICLWGYSLLVNLISELTVQDYWQETDGLFVDNSLIF